MFKNISKKFIAVSLFISASSSLLAGNFNALEQEYRKLYREKKLDECIVKCDEAFKEAASERDKWETYFYRYNCYMLLKKYDDAMKITTEMQKLPKYKWRGSMFQIRCLMNQRKYAEAAGLIKPEAIKDWPENAKVEYYFQVGNANLYAQNYDEAQKNYEQGLTLTQKLNWKINFLRQTGNVLLRKKEFDKAIEKYNEVLALPSLNDSAKCDIYISIGNAYEVQKKYAEATEAYLKGSKCSQAHGARIPSSLSRAARTLQKSGDTEKALELYKKTLAHEKCYPGLEKYAESQIERLEE